MSTPRRVTIALFLLAAVGAGLGVESLYPKPWTPALLRNVRAGGGWFSTGCPQSQWGPRLSEAIAPDLQARLDVAFPDGSDAAQLRSTLEEQGFRFGGSCLHDPSIQHVDFEQTGGSIIRVPMSATVAWTTDPEGRVVWTKGFVRYRL